MVSKDVIKAIGNFTTCDAADALQKLRVPHGGFLSGLTMWSLRRQSGTTKIVGPAYTVKYVPKHDETAPKPSGHYIDSIPAGSVVFISSPPRLINAVYGGLMTTRAKASGAVGTVVDGRIRDLQEHREAGYPVFARDVGTSAPAEVVRVSEINAPVKLQTDEQDAIIHPGDIIIADLNGVVCIPQDLADRIVDLMASQAEADEKVAADIRAGRTFTEASKEHRSKVKQP
ncbi:RraA-like protein [Myriangium duriaei CBS 260.36]|uniref:RraA-like protein n=1 Tax=Myriangium duriaei CBS 260.36 TaxID=1168546 RepID=A0A9P4JEW2_9PEZI|nr:RraA-like protein [Myriangium duriaei CBS 260.36]